MFGSRREAQLKGSDEREGWKCWLVLLEWQTCGIVLLLTTSTPCHLSCSCWAQGQLQLLSCVLSEALWTENLVFRVPWQGFDWWIADYKDFSDYVVRGNEWKIPKMETRSCWKVLLYVNYISGVTKLHVSAISWKDIRSVCMKFTLMLSPKETKL